MLKGKQFTSNLSSFQKIICLISLLGVVLVLSIAIPTLARYKNRNVLPSNTVWDGSVATKYRRGNGSMEEPYIISNGAELAYFSLQLNDNEYNNTYFELSSDIVLNDGIFKYDDENGVQYIVDNQTYYVDEYTGKYYDNVDLVGDSIGTLNILNSLNGFKGTFNGNLFTIYGLYITSENNEEVALFTELKGFIHDVYVDNSVVYGGLYTGGIASKTDNSVIKNVLFDGYVIGKNNNLINNKAVSLNAPIINLSNTWETTYIDLNSNIPVSGGEIISTTISGDYIINGETSGENIIKISDVIVSGGSFEIELGSSILNNIAVSVYTDSTTNVTLEFSNLKYNVTYNYAVAGGVVAYGNNTRLENVINKANVYGYTTSGGLVGVSTNAIHIKQSYNVGEIVSNINSGGIIGVVERSNDSVTISKCYNNGNVTSPSSGGLVGVINNNVGEVIITDVFDASIDNYSIGTITNSNVIVNNYFYNNNVPGINNGVVNGIVNFTTSESLRSKNFIVENLSYTEFSSYDDLKINDENVWVYEKNSLPILYMDSSINPVANVHVSIYSWNNFSTKLKNFKFTTNITFSIRDVSELSPTKETYYYISNTRNALTKDELDAIDNWVTYDDIVRITDEGVYVVYAKIIDYDDVVTYINTDLLILDLPGSVASIQTKGMEWADFKSNLERIYFNQPTDFVVQTNDSISLPTSIKYHISDKVLTEKDLTNLNESSWTTYNDKITVDNVGKSVIYIQVIDDFDYITYINTDFIILEGYVTNDLVIGRNTNSYLGYYPNITSKSTISLNFTYSSNSAEEPNEYKHNLISNLLLPLGTKITLIDNTKNKVYTYQIPTADDYYNYNNSCAPEDLECIKVATYPFTLFKEVGAVNKYFIEDNYYLDGVIQENFTVVLDLVDTDISSNYNDIYLYLELHNNSSNNIRPTLFNTIKKFNIYSNNVGSKLYLTTDYNGDSIEYNSNSSTNINISSGLNYKNISENKIIDTTYEDKAIGLSIKLLDSDGNIVDKEHLKNIVFKVGENKYYPENDNITRINLNNGINDFNDKLTIITNKNKNTLEPGTYYLKISNYVSIDGYYYDKLGSDEINIPVNVSNDNYIIQYGFDVLMDNTNHIIDKKSPTVLVAFDILQYGSLKNPNIRISLYKKNLLTAYDQNYSLVDLANYVSDELVQYATNIYYVSTNPVEYNHEQKLYNHFELNLLTDNFENNGYKFVFDLYDGNKKIGTIEKYFIVK